MFYISNLAAGLETGLDRPSFLLEAVQPFAGRAGIEFFLHDHDAAYRAKTAEIGSWIGDLPRTVHGPFIGVEASSPLDSDAHRHVIDAYIRAFGAAKALGCSEMVFHTHQRIIEEEEACQAREAVYKTLQELIDLARAYGITILVENLDFQRQGVSLFDERRFAELIEAFPDAGCLIDLGHLHVAGWDLDRTLQRLAGRIRGYHLHNNDGMRDTHLPIGRGTLNYERFYPLYRTFTPDAYLTLEYGDGPEITPALLSADLKTVMMALQGATPQIER